MVLASKNPHRPGPNCNSAVLRNRLIGHAHRDALLSRFWGRSLSNTTNFDAARRQSCAVVKMWGGWVGYSAPQLFHAGQVSKTRAKCNRKGVWFQLPHILLPQSHCGSCDQDEETAYGKDECFTHDGPRQCGARRGPLGQRRVVGSRSMDRPPRAELLPAR